MCTDGGHFTKFVKGRGGRYMITEIITLEYNAWNILNSIYILSAVTALSWFTIELPLSISYNLKIFRNCLGKVSFKKILKTKPVLVVHVTIIFCLYLTSLSKFLVISTFCLINIRSWAASDFASLVFCCVASRRFNVCRNSSSVSFCFDWILSIAISSSSSFSRTKGLKKSLKIILA